MAMSIHKPKYIVLRMSLVAILVCLFVWSYILFSQNYARVELSQKMVGALLDNETELAREYADQLGIVQENLDRTETFLNDVRQENLQLKEKIALLDQLKSMEQELGQLKDENTKMQAEMLDESSGDQKDGGIYFDTIEKGRELLKKFKHKLHAVKKRISFLRKEDRQKEIVFQQDIDHKKSLLGNNGYLIKDGKLMPVSMPNLDQSPENATINVKFVK